MSNDDVAGGVRVGLIGAGNLARALARGLGGPVLATDGGSGRAAALVAEVGGEVPPSNRDLAERADVVVLAHERDGLRDVAREIDGAAKIVVSLLGRTTIADVRAVLPNAQVLRVTPNLAVEVRRGVSAFARPRPGVGRRADETVKALFARVGQVVEVPEELMPVAVGCAGAGPAFWALLVDAWSAAAERHGLPRDVATSLIVETMAGSAALLARREGDALGALGLARAVATPGGATERGLAALGGAREAVAAAVDAVVAAYEPGTLPPPGARPARENPHAARENPHAARENPHSETLSPPRGDRT
jgi:pyrroline-5-carboxylate reductase